MSDENVESKTSFRKDRSSLAREQLNLSLLICIILVPLTTFIDHFLYPELFKRFLAYRWAVTVSCAGLYLVNKNRNWGIHTAHLGVMAYYVVGLSVVKMIVDTGGYGTPYYVGLILVFVTFYNALKTDIRLLQIHFPLLYVVCIICVVMFNHPHKLHLFFLNTIFIACTLVVGVIAASNEYGHQLRQYLSSAELELTHKQLSSSPGNPTRKAAQTNEEYRFVVDRINESILIVQDDLIRFSNPKTHELFQYSEQELGTIPFSHLITAQDRERVIEELRQIEREKGKSQNVKFRVTSKLGQIRWVDMNSVPVEWQTKPALLLSLTDTTEKTKTEFHLSQARKMEVIGTLAGGVAHEFNNLLQVIIGYLQLLLKKKPLEDPELRYLQRIEASAQRAAELTKKLLIFGRKVENKVQTVDLNQQVTQVFELFKRVFPREISINLQLVEDLRHINADPTQIEQIIMNLALNARDAMVEGGIFTLETNNIDMDEASSRDLTGMLPGQYVLLTVSDTGQGMDQETLERIFDPFFTTKSPGKGTGLGLGIVYSIVSSHGGYIKCDSREGDGSTFEIYFPAAQRYIPDQTIKDEKKEPLRGSGETLLLVDDEIDFLEVGKEILELYDYRVLTAESGQEALDIFTVQQGAIDAVILDLHMPGMDGFQCLKKLLEIEPHLKVIIAAGYMDKPRSQQLLRFGASALISKPFHFSEMLEQIRRVLRGSQ